MNERIQELKRQASMWCDQNIPGEFDEDIGGYGYHWEDKFAELIVKECLSYMEEGDIDYTKWMIKEHFGVEA